MLISTRLIITSRLRFVSICLCVCLSVDFYELCNVQQRKRYSDFHESNNSVADPGFVREGSANPRGGAPTYYLVYFFPKKLHENEEI